RKAVLFVISDFLTYDFERALAVVSRRHDTVAIVVEDPMEQQLPEAGLLEIIDGETGKPVVVDTQSAAVRRQFEAFSRRLQQERLSVSRRHEIDSIELRTDRPYQTELVQFFHRRARRLTR